jgi:hypothetical protein
MAAPYCRVAKTAASIMRGKKQKPRSGGGVFTQTIKFA